MSHSLKVAVTGATGFIGQALRRGLTTRGDSVTALTRGAARSAGGVQFQHWDPESDASVGFDAAGAPDAIVHLAGERAVGVRWTAAVKRNILESRVRSTERLVAAIESAARRPRVFVCASAVGYYGARGEELLDEQASPGKDFLAQVTTEWERAASRAEVLGVRVVRARFGVVIGKGGGALAEMVKPFRLFVGGPIGSGAQFVSWVHLEDVVGAVLLSIDDERIRGAVNVVAPNAVTNRYLSTQIGKVLGRPSAVAVPAAALRLRFGEGAEPLVTGQRVVPRVLESAGYGFRFARIEDALAEALTAK